MSVHSTAIISNKAQIDSDIYIGPYCIVGDNVKLEKGVHLEAHVFISGNTTIGEGTKIYPFASIGTAPQDLKYKGNSTYLKIGNRNTIREHVTISPGTEHGGGLTEIGDENLLMIGCHIGHDCKIANKCVVSNNVAVAGHVILDDFVIIGGNSAVHQFCRIGMYSMVGGMSGVGNDIPPFALAFGGNTSVRGATVRGVNLVGLKRHSFTRETIRRIMNAYEILFKGTKTLKDRIQELEIAQGDDENIRYLIEFIAKSDSGRNLAQWYTGEHSEGAENSNDFI